MGSAIDNTGVRWMDTGQTNRYRTKAYTALCIRNAYARPVKIREKNLVVLFVIFTQTSFAVHHRILKM